MENQELNTLVKYDISEAAIEELRRRCLPLKVENFEDKEGYRQCIDARREVKTLRVNIEKRRKELKADSLAFGRLVDSKAKELSQPLLEIEAHLQTQQNVVDDEVKRRKEEEERKEREKLETRFRELTQLGFAANMPELRAMTEERYQEVVQQARTAKAAIDAQKKKEQEEAEQRRRELEEQAAAARKEAEELRAKLAEKEKAEREESEARERQLRIEETKGLTHSALIEDEIQNPQAKPVLNLENTIKEIRNLIDYDDSEIDDESYGGMNINVGGWSTSVMSHCEPEDAIWGRDLQDIFYAGVEAGIRAALQHFGNKTTS